MSRERLWSPQMRKWVRDADRHGLQIAWEKYGKTKPRDVWAADGGAGNPYTDRLTDDGNPRVTDQAASLVAGLLPVTANANYITSNQPNAIIFRTTGRPVAANHLVTALNASFKRTVDNTSSGSSFALPVGITVLTSESAILLTSESGIQLTP